MQEIKGDHKDKSYQNVLLGFEHNKERILDVLISKLQLVGLIVLARR
jgi:hypothetical protein